jgi:hypothetical protein
VIHDGRNQVVEIMLREAEVNKTQLIDALAERLGDKKIAAAAVAGLVDEEGCQDVRHQELSRSQERPGGASQPTASL